MRTRWILFFGAAMLAGMLAGCFQPMYADRSLTGGTGPNLREAMRDVEIAIGAFALSQLTAVREQYATAEQSAKKR